MSSIAPKTLSLQLNDAVSVTSSHCQNDEVLEGVVAFQGSVAFESGDDWIGVRLTGRSIGRGRNNGSVQGHAYFECPEKCGIFVRSAAAQKRNLTRLEELRLRRELGTAAVASGAVSGAANYTATTPPRSASSTR